MTSWLILLPIAAGVAMCIFLAHDIRARKFRNREAVPFDQIYSSNLQSSGVPKDLASELWSEAARTLRIPATKLRPSDRFDRELNYHLSWLPFVDLNDDFYWAAVARLKRLNADKALFENARTLGDYVVTFARLEATKISAGACTQT